MCLYPGLPQKQCGQEAEGGDSVPLLCAGETHLERGVQLWDPQKKKDMDLLKTAQRRAMKMARGMEHPLTMTGRES